MMKLLELHKIRKEYDNDVILSDVSVAVEKGTALAITGDSGGGKTTLLSIMGLLQNATAGKVLVNGRDVSAADPREQAKIRSHYFGFVFQRCLLEARNTGAGVVLVTHDPILAARADIVLCLANGQLYPADGREQEQEKRVFLA